ncbi:MAG TPA: Rne/Rng family ribonuclease [Xanthobacteraceae bacterium]|nr:Rne/Rng family ribonuclease [Xanthobacteraceae bacterium]
MANKMLIDATHPEETRVVVVRGSRVEEFDFESASRRPLRGNIYLAKVTRVEPSLQACFVDYGGNRHGFLAFSEIHPDYYQIPVADRQALIAEEAREARDAEADHEQRRGRRRERPRSARPSETVSEMPAEDTASAHASDVTEFSAERESPPAEANESEAPAVEAPAEEVSYDYVEELAETSSEASAQGEENPFGEMSATDAREENGAEGGSEPGQGETQENGQENGQERNDHGDREHDHDSEDEVVESVGAGDALEEVPERQHRPRRHYKIQEVIKRRQVMLVQVVKEERGTKGAAMTTYLSLAGRYSVLMPNTSRGGGISRKITDGADRKRLKDLVQDLEVPEGMGVILRTAGASRTKAEIKRDYEYLLRLWETVRELTLKSSAPALTYEEGSLIKRAIRDLYNKDIDEVLVAGDDGYKDAKEFMRMLMPSHAKNVKPYKDAQPLFVRYGVESQLDAMFSPVVQLKSGGYIVINPTEALVAVDVNSGRSTREHHIEDTALRTNMEAAEEVARQLRLRDLAGLIVIDFIDMEQKRNNRSVERMLKDCLKHDRARIQVGRISHFGLMEMSRQRIRTGVLESSTIPCAICGGTGHVRSVSSVALHLLRSLEEQLIKNSSHDLIVRTKSDVALYLLNQKRAHLRELEQRFGVNILIQADAALSGQQYFAVDRGPPARPPVVAPVTRVAPDSVAPEVEEDEEDIEVEADSGSEADEESDEAPQHGREHGEQGEDGEHGRGRRRRRRRRGRGRGREGQEHAPFGEERPQEHRAESHSETADGDEGDDGEAAGQPNGGGEHRHADDGDGGQRRRRRRGRRGGRRNRRDRGEQDEHRAPGAEGEQRPAAHHEEQFESGGDPFRSVTEPAPEPRYENAAPIQERTPEPGLAPQPEPEPRRKSTVRERFFGRADPAPEESAREESAQPQPANGDSESMSPDRPRRSGWWNRGR